MRKLTLLFLPLAGGCGDVAATPAVIESFRADAAALTCEPVDLGVDTAPAELRLASDSTWTLLDEAHRQLLEVTDDFRIVRQIDLPATGPGAVDHPISATVLGDTAVAIAARGGLRLVVLAMDGALRRSVPLEFIPNAIMASGSGILATPMPFGDRPSTLLLRNVGDDWEEVPVPRRAYDDMSIAALGNAALVETFPDGRILLMHQFFRPRAFIVDAHRIDELTPPVPDGARDQLDFVPRAPITDDQIRRTLVPALAMTIDPIRSEVYVLTRSGGELDDRLERAILRLSDRLEFIEGYTLPVIARSMVILPRRRSALVVDDVDTFHLCSLPVTPDTP